MKKKLLEIVRYINPERLRNDRRIVVFSICLLIAIGLWFLNAMSKDYSTTISFPVKYTNPPENQFLANSPPSKFELNVEAHGFTLLRHKLTFSLSPILINLTTISQSNQGSGTTYPVQNEDLIRRISTQVSKEISITDINPKEITLVFDSLKSKKVPVKADISVDFAPQHYLRDSVEVKPAELEISGPASALDTIHSLKTQFKKYDGADKTFERIIRVEHPRNTDISPEKVIVTIPVERFTEKEFKIPVEVKNLPEEDTSIKLFPSDVKVSFLVGLSEYENVTESDFKAVVDYNSISKNDENLEVTIESQPPLIQTLRVSPGTVEYLIETN